VSEAQREKGEVADPESSGGDHLVGNIVAEIDRADTENILGSAGRVQSPIAISTRITSSKDDQDILRS
jgi:hypothetical protein